MAETNENVWFDSVRHLSTHFGYETISKLEIKSRRNRDPTLMLRSNKKNAAWPINAEIVSRVLRHRERLLRFIYSSSVLNRDNVTLDLNSTERTTSWTERVLWTAVLERNAFMTLDKYVACVSSACPNLLTRSQWESVWNASQTQTSLPNSFYYPHFVLSLILAAKKIVAGGPFEESKLSQKLEVLLTLFIPDRRAVALNVFDLLRNEPYSTSITCSWWRWKGLSSFEHQIAVSTMQLLRGHESSLLNLFERYGTMEVEMEGDALLMMMCQNDACRFADDFKISRFVRRHCILSSELRLDDIASSCSSEDFEPLIQSQIHQIFFASWRSYVRHFFYHLFFFLTQTCRKTFIFFVYDFVSQIIDGAVDDESVKIVLDFDCFVEFCARIAIALYVIKQHANTLSGHAPDIAIDIVKSFLGKLNKGSLHLTDELFDVSLLS